MIALNGIMKYDSSDPMSIRDYAKELIDSTFLDIINRYAKDSDELLELKKQYNQKGRRGGLGNLIEELYFEYKANNESEPDFKEAGIELKVSPLELKKDGTMRAGERLVLTMISYNTPVEHNFYESHLWKKCRILLLIYYLRDRTLASQLLYKIKYAEVFTPIKNDLIIIKQDYNFIISKIENGEAHELSESDTMYLGACTKGKTAELSTVPQYYNPEVPARRRAFCYKMSYMTYVINNYLAPGVISYEDESILKYKSLDSPFGDYLTSLIDRYRGLTDIELCRMFDREYNNNKAQWIDLAFRMLGLKSNRAQELLKANIKVKAIRLEKSGRMRENSPLPTIKFKELIHEEWEDSSLYNYFYETKFLFVVFKKEGSCYKLKGCQLWNMPYRDLNEIVQEGWVRVRQIARRGIELVPQTTAKGIIIKNNLPPKNDNPIIHVRPHTSKRYYLLKSGAILGDGTPSNGDELPDGQWMPKQSFWLNNTYILSQLKEYLKKD